MTTLQWDQVGERKFEVGVDRGVLYPPSGGGVAWNGLISVEENPVGGELNSYYFDGVKYLDDVSAEDFQATITAFTYPDEFDECNGFYEVQDGMFATQQPRLPFNLCYRTRLGDDVDGYKHGYKLHLVYNAMAAPSGRVYSTMTQTIDPLNFVWVISATPPLSSTFKPTAHLEINSNKVSAEGLATLEDVLYGTDDVDPTFPTQLAVQTALNAVIDTSLISEPIAEFF